MANRRMFSKTITNSSKFLMLPPSAQSLYFHLGMNADDDGYCEHFTIMRMTNGKENDLKLLEENNLIKVFDDKVLIIIDWKENNQIRKDRYKASIYKDIYSMATSGKPKDNQAGDNGLPQDSIGKDSIGKENTNSEKHCCGKVMKLKKGKNGQFWGCSDFPKCRNTESYFVTEDKTPAEVNEKRALEARISKLPPYIEVGDTVLCREDFDALYRNSDAAGKLKLKKDLKESRNSRKKITELTRSIGG